MPNRYYVIGDIHGSYPALEHLLANMTLDKDTYVIMCGDVGILYGDNKMGSLLHKMVKYSCTFVVMRGNHDARYWKRYRERGESLEVFDMWGNQMARQGKYPNVWYVRDEGGLYEVPQVGNVLFIPGAYSVDKWHRLQRGMAWEHDEQLTYAEMDALIEIAQNNYIDAVISHTCPLSWQPQFKDLFLDGLDQGSIENGMEKFLDVIYDIVKPTYRQWFFGHYHDDRFIFDEADYHSPLVSTPIGVMLYKYYDVLGGYLG